MAQFGELLRSYRIAARDPEGGGVLTQQRLADLISQQLGNDPPSPTHATVSNWEREKTVPHHSMLRGVVTVLVQCAGITSVEEANSLWIAAGRDEALSQEEADSLFRFPASFKKGGSKDLGASLDMIPDVSGFVGREEELTLLRNAHSRYQIVTLSGLPGIGKTFLAGYYAKFMRSDHRILWLDAQEVDTEQLISRLRPLFHGKSAQDAFARVLDTIEEGSADNITQLTGHITSLFHYLSRSPILIVFDNFSGVYGDLAPVLFSIDRFSNLKALLITRFSKGEPPLRIANKIKTLNIGGFDQVDAKNYIERVCELNELDTLTETDKSVVATAANGHPLAINLAILGIKQGLSPEIISQKLAKFDDIAGAQLKRLLREILPALPASEREALLKLAVLAEDTPVEVISYLGIEPFVIERLKSKGLLNSVDNRFVRVHDLSREFLYETLDDSEKSLWHTLVGKFYRDRYADEETGDPIVALQRAIAHFRIAASLPGNSAHLGMVLDAADFLARYLFQLDVSPSERLFGLVSWFRALELSALQSYRWLILQVARTAEYERDYERSLEALQIAEQHFQSDYDRTGLLAVFFYRGKIEYMLSKYEDSLNTYEQAYNLTNNDSVAEVRILRKLADLNQKIGNEVEAHEYGQAALQVSRKIHDPLGEILCEYLLGKLARNRGHFLRAFRHFERALNLMTDELYEPYLKSKILCRLGVVCTYTGDLELARQFLGESIAMKKQVADEYGLAMDLDYLGDVEFEKGNYRSAEAKYLESKEIKQALDDLYGNVKADNNLGRLYIRLGDWVKAHKHLRQRDLDSRASRRGAEIERISREGVLYLEQGEVDLAIKRLEEAQIHYERNLIIHSLASTNSRLGKAYLLKGDTQKAKTCLEEALEAAIKCGYKSCLIETHLSCATLDSVEGSYMLALNHIDEASSISRNTEKQYELVLAREAELKLRYLYGTVSPDEYTTSLQVIRKDYELLKVLPDIARVNFLIDLVTVYQAGQSKHVLDPSRLNELESKIKNNIQYEYAARLQLLSFLTYLENLDQLPERVAHHLAGNGLLIFGAVAGCLGFDYPKLRRQIEDICFEYLYPIEFARIKGLIDTKYPDLKSSLQRLKEEVGSTLQQMKWSRDEYEIETRIKGVYSIYCKEISNQKQLLEEGGILDLIGARLIVDSEEDSISKCYQATGAILGWFGGPYESPVLEEPIRDYIANPKPNGYRAIHFNVVLHGTKQVAEIQVCNREMYESVKSSVSASHNKYKAQSLKALTGQRITSLKLGNKQTKDYKKHRVQAVFEIHSEGSGISLPLVVREFESFQNIEDAEVEDTFWGKRILAKYWSNSPRPRALFSKLDNHAQKVLKSLKVIAVESEQDEVAADLEDIKIISGLLHIVRLDFTGEASTAEKNRLMMIMTQVLSQITQGNAYWIEPPTFSNDRTTLIGNAYFYGETEIEMTHDLLVASPSVRDVSILLA